jgi:hypothetical protein
MNTEFKGFVHPLSSLETIDTDIGKKKVINSWAFASMIWSQVLAGNSNALGIAQELFPIASKIPLLILRSKQKDKAAIREAVGILAFAMDEKITEAFEKK